MEQIKFELFVYDYDGQQYSDNLGYKISDDACEYFEFPQEQCEFD